MAFGKRRQLRAQPRNRTCGAFVAFVLFVVAVAAGFTTSKSAVAQELDIQQFRPRAGEGSALGLESAETPGHLNWHAALFTNFADEPLSLRTEASGSTTSLLDDQLAADLLVAIGIGQDFQVSLELPLLLNQRVGAGSIDLFGNGGIDAARGGFGDLRLIGKRTLLRYGHMRLAASTALLLPTGAGGDFRSQGSLGLHPVVAGGYQFGASSRDVLLLNLGLRLRRQRVFADLETGSEFTYGFGARVGFDIAGVGMIALSTISGAVHLPSARSTQAPLEFDGGIEYPVTERLTITLAAGAGIGRGYGAPRLRLIAGLAFRGKGAAAQENPRCLYGPEDFDGFQDEDSCADPDNDQDGIEDEEDRCPNEAETRNGYRDDDGCPEQPTESDFAESTRGAIANRSDDDGDGVTGDDDLCPDAAEDMDGFEDSDGCPDLDNDGDGFAGADDQCPLRAGSPGSSSGCPDPAPIPVLGKIEFETAKAVIRPRSRKILDKVARVLRQRPELTRVSVDGHTDNQGSADDNRALALERARAVVEYLVRAGIDAGRLQARGFGADKPLVPNDTAANRERNRRVEFTILSAEAEAARPKHPAESRTKP